MPMSLQACSNLQIFCKPIKPIRTSTWQQQASNTTRELRSVSFAPDSQRGWAVGKDGRIIKTTDGGSTWEEKTVHASPIEDFNAVHFVDDNKGWAVGNNGAIVKTTDGGITWSGSRAGLSVDLHSVMFVGNPVGGAVGADGTVLSSDDAGASWTQQNGIIDQNTVWQSDQPIQHITGHITVDSGVTLTIEPGVTVKADAGKSLIINGTISATGTSNSPITFTGERTPRLRR